MKSKKTTVKDLASATGFSAMTVSRALNNSRDVTEETRRIILGCAEKMNYKPDMIAKSMRLNRTNTIGLVVSDSSFSFFPNVIKGIESVASKNGYGVILCNSNSDYQTEKKVVSLLSAKRVDGIILAASTLVTDDDIDFLNSVQIPYVYTIREPTVPNVNCVVNDNYFGAKTMIEHLIKTGSKKIHVIGLPQNSPSGAVRIKGYLDALEENGIPLDMTLISNVSPTIDDGYIKARSLLESGQDIGAIFCGCDIIAVGVMEAVLEKGLSIPGDVRVCGYDDIDFAAYLRVPLTTVRQPKYTMGEKSVELLLTLINEPSAEPQRFVYRPELIVRKST